MMIKSLLFLSLVVSLCAQQAAVVRIEDRGAKYVKTDRPVVHLVYSNSTYITAYENRTTWAEAEALCHSVDSEVAVILGEQEEQALHKIRPSFWIGLYRTASGKWAWVGNDTELHLEDSFINWAPGHPRNDSSLRCAMLTVAAARLQDNSEATPPAVYKSVHCNTPLASLCVGPKIPLARRYAKQQDGSYISMIALHMPASWKFAQAQCRTYGAELLNIPDETFAIKLTAFANIAFWLGIQKVNTQSTPEGITMEWQWIGNKTVKKMLPSESQPTDAELLNNVDVSAGRCGAYFSMEARWNDLPCNGFARVMCTKAANNDYLGLRVFAVASSKVDEIWLDAAEGPQLSLPMVFFPRPAAYKEAQSYCQAINASLVKMIGHDSSLLIQSTAEVYLYKDYFFITTPKDLLNELVGSLYRHSQNAANVNDSLVGGRAKGCVVVSATDKIWKLVDCNDPHPFICQQPGGTITEDEEIATSSVPLPLPLLPSTASTATRFARAHLTIVISVTVGFVTLTSVAALALYLRYRSRPSADLKPTPECPVIAEIILLPSLAVPPAPIESRRGRGRRRGGGGRDRERRFAGNAAGGLELEVVVARPDVEGSSTSAYQQQLGTPHEQQMASIASTSGSTADLAHRSLSPPPLRSVPPSVHPDESPYELAHGGGLGQGLCGLQQGLEGGDRRGGVAPVNDSGGTRSLSDAQEHRRVPDTGTGAGPGTGAGTAAGAEVAPAVYGEIYPAADSGM